MHDTDATNDNSEDEKPRRASPMGFLAHWDSYMDRIIEEAQADGAFDNLPGRGKPLQVDKNPYAGDKELAYKLLKDNNFTLPWIAERNMLLAEIDAFRDELTRTWSPFLLEWQTSAAPTQRDALRHRWRLQQAAWRAELKTLNQRIHNLNLQLPVDVLEIVQLDLARELKRIGAPAEMN